MKPQNPEKNLSVQEVVDLLKARGITPTQQRVEIAQILFARPQHLSADQIQSLVNQDHAAASKATVYNTLNLFARKGLIREVIVDPSRVFYDSTTREHYHFFNVDTGELTDMPDGVVSVGALPPLPDGTVAIGVDVVVRISSASHAAA